MKGAAAPNRRKVAAPPPPTADQCTDAQQRTTQLVGGGGPCLPLLYPKPFPRHPLLMANAHAAASKIGSSFTMSCCCVAGTRNEAPSRTRRASPLPPPPSPDAASPVVRSHNAEIVPLHRPDPVLRRRECEKQQRVKQTRPLATQGAVQSVATSAHQPLLRCADTEDA